MRTTLEIMKTAREKCDVLKMLSSQEKNAALINMASSLLEKTEHILEENRKDIEAARGKIGEVMLDRLTLTPERIKAMSDGIIEVSKLPDPVGNIISETVRPNGLVIKKTTVPLGVVAIIYESRPNVTSDAASLAFKSSNTVILRSGKEAFSSAYAIVEALQDGLVKSNLPKHLIQIVEDTTRESARELMTGVGYIDLLIPRGGKGLIKACVENATVPCIETGTGICHVYVEKSADFKMALNIIENAKTSRPSVCNAEEVLLVDEAVANEFLPLLKERLVDKRARPIELRLDEKSAEIIEGVPASESDFDTEFLDYILAVKIVSSTKDAIEHISQHSTHHSESIITNDVSAAELFTKSVDSAAVYVNASTSFTDGGEFGLGCEMGISTQKLHARGPMGLSEMTTYKYIINGNGQIR